MCTLSHHGQDAVLDGVQVGSQDCQETVLLATCLELYPVCSASPSRFSCSLSCDKWKLHVGSACSGAEDCLSVLQQVVDVCPLSEGHTLFTSSGVQCQRLSVGECVLAQNMWLDKCLCLWFVSLCADLHRRITSGTVSGEAQ